MVPIGRDGPASLRAGAKKHNQTIKIGNYQKTNKNQGKQSKMMKNNQKIIKNNQKSIEKRENGLGRAGAHFHVFR